MLALLALKLAQHLLEVVQPLVYAPVPYFVVTQVGYNILLILVKRTTSYHTSFIGSLRSGQNISNLYIDMIN